LLSAALSEGTNPSKSTAAKEIIVDFMKASVYLSCCRQRQTDKINFAATVGNLVASKMSCQANFTIHCKSSLR